MLISSSLALQLVEAVNPAMPTAEGREVHLGQRQDPAPDTPLSNQGALVEGMERTSPALGTLH